MSDFEVCPVGTQARLEAVEAVAVALLKALNEYGRHHDECLWRRGFDCNCGFHAAIDAAMNGGSNG